MGRRLRHRAVDKGAAGPMSNDRDATCQGYSSLCTECWEKAVQFHHQQTRKRRLLILEWVHWQIMKPDEALEHLP